MGVRWDGEPAGDRSAGPGQGDEILPGVRVLHRRNYAHDAGRDLRDPGEQAQKRGSDGRRGRGRNARHECVIFDSTPLLRDENKAITLPLREIPSYSWMRVLFLQVYSTEEEARRRRDAAH